MYILIDGIILKVFAHSRYEVWEGLLITLAMSRQLLAPVTET